MQPWKPPSPGADIPLTHPTMAYRAIYFRVDMLRVAEQNQWWIIHENLGNFSTFILELSQFLNRWVGFLESLVAQHALRCVRNLHFPGGFR